MAPFLKISDISEQLCVVLLCALSACKHYVLGGTLSSLTLLAAVAVTCSILEGPLIVFATSVPFFVCS